MSATEILEVGPAGGPVADTSKLMIRGTRSKAAGVQQILGKYVEALLNGNLFCASNQAAQAVSVALATTYTGIMLSNPAGNDKIALLYFAQYALTVAPAAIASLHLIGGYTAAGVVTHTAAITPENCLAGSVRPSSMKVDSQATIPTPTYRASLANGFTAGALPGGNTPFFEAEGIFGLLPGGFIGIGALTAVVGLGTLIYEEVSLGLYRT